jgi:hypothetical protein
MSIALRSRTSDPRIDRAADRTEVAIRPLLLLCSSID